MKPLVLATSALVLLPFFAHAGPPLAADGYTSAIEHAKRSGSADRGPELRHCLAGIHGTAPKKLRSELSRSDLFSASAYVALEVSSGSWNSYSFSFLWIDERGDGRIATDRAGGALGHRSDRVFPANELKKLLIAANLKESPIVGTINTNVDDGDCFFVTIKHESVAKRFVVYAPKTGDEAIEESERIIDQIANFTGAHTGR